MLEVSPTAKCSSGISTEPGINSHGRVHYQPQVGYHNNNKMASADYVAIEMKHLITNKKKESIRHLGVKGDLLGFMQEIKI